MAEYTGKDLFLSWTSTSGTVTPAADYRSVTYTPSIDLIDTTAGSDAAKTYITGYKDAQLSISLLMQTDGTATTNAFIEGAVGTLIVAPEGTATGNEKLTIPAISLGVKRNYPYNNLVELTIDLQQYGVRVDGSY